MLHGSLFGWWALPLPLAFAVLAGLTIAGAAVSAFLGIRAGRDMRGISSHCGMFFGSIWAAGLFSAGFIIVALLKLDLAMATTVWLSSAVLTLLIGVLFAAGGAVLLDRATFTQGLATLAANLVAVLIGTGPFVLIG